MKTISEFRDEYFFLSNFYECPITFDGITYLNAEACFQAQKTLDNNIKKQFALLNPSEAKKMGRSINLRKDWENIKVDIMRKIINEKFNDPILREKLLTTYPSYLEEGNNWNDKIWGTVNHQGQNLLGKILMDKRNELQKISELEEIER